MPNPDGFLLSKRKSISFFWISAVIELIVSNFSNEARKTGNWHNNCIMFKQLEILRMNVGCMKRSNLFQKGGWFTSRTDSRMDWMMCMSYCKRLVDLETEEIFQSLSYWEGREGGDIFGPRAGGKLQQWHLEYNCGGEVLVDRENLSEIRDTCTWTTAVVWTLNKGVFWKNFQSRCRNFQ